MQIAAAPESAERDHTYLPAEPIAGILDAMLATQLDFDFTSQEACGNYRQDMCSVFNYVDFARSDSGAPMKLCDVAMDDVEDVLLFRLRKVKGKVSRRHHLIFQWPVGVLADPGFRWRPDGSDQSVVEVAVGHCGAQRADICEIQAGVFGAFWIFFSWEF